MRGAAIQPVGEGLAVDEFESLEGGCLIVAVNRPDRGWGGRGRG